MTTISKFTFQDMAIDIADGAEYTVGKGNVLTLEILGTATGSKVEFEGKGLSGAYYSIVGTKISSVDLTKAVETTSLGELWQFDLTGISAVRAKITTISGGYVTVLGKIVDSNF